MAKKIRSQKLDFSKITGETIKQWRKNVGIMTQTELADRLDVTRATICRWENQDEEPSIENKRKLLALFQEVKNG